MRFPALAAALLLLGVSSASASAEEPDQDRALAAVAHGASVPLEAVLAKLRSEHPGKVLDVELEDEGRRLIYEVRLLAPGGRIETWRYDARTLAAVPAASDAPPVPDHREE